MKDVILEYESFTPNNIAHAKCVIFFKLCYTCKYIYPAISTFAVQICYTNKFLLYSY